ncbi:MAG: RNA polymerase sigma factor [Phycisphaerales bacterium]
MPDRPRLFSPTAPARPPLSTDDPRSDEALVAAINAGDPRAFETLYRRHRDWVVRLALRFTRDEADALDVMQETFEYLLRKFPGFTLTARLTTFLYPAVRHNAMALARKRHGALRLSAGEGEPGGVPLPAAPTSSGPSSAETERRAGLAAVLSCLPEAQREVVLLRFVQDLSLEEIGLALGIPTGTVKSRLHHALNTLRADPLTRAYFEQPPPPGPISSRPQSTG